MITQRFFKRRRFLQYLIGSGLATTAISWLWTLTKTSRAVDLDDFCLTYPHNSQCDDYLPGVQALDEADNPYQADTILAQADTGDRLLAQGLRKEVYLVIEEEPKIASYAISSVCTHLRCTVNWDQAGQEFVCPCHGSRFDSLGRVNRGPARRSLALVTVVVKENQVRLVDREPRENPRT
ncbi:MAG: Rieske 2Fe-2S domain-containing protein [Leptolyngbyaceae cyanobacterium MO_188.B28]|nr:Rieske 2Fe-2S domain-containing protein [Leptolyngbyaceae cyanobacterium MO_188.B28]